jgi:hypothetical protein
MFNQESAEKFAYQLESDWNSQEINDFLNYFTEDVEIVSSNILRFVNESNGTISGKETLRKYWEFAREKFPYFKYKLSEINFKGNVLILKFYNSIDDSYSYGNLTINDDMVITKMVVSYV